MYCWYQRAGKRLDNTLLGNLEPLVVKSSMEDPPSELGVRKSVEYDTLSFQCS